MTSLIDATVILEPFVYSSVPNNSPPLINFWILLEPAPPPRFLFGPPPPPPIINFPDFGLQIFQRLLKLIALFAKL